MRKSPEAFRTISEVADWLGIQAHVLRFWESKFTQVKPIKRAGGRRYYRPADMLLLGGIKALLHDDGLTIKGVQKILREEGMAHVAGLSQPLDDVTASEMDPAADAQEAASVIEHTPAPEPESVVLPFEQSASEEAPSEDISQSTPQDAAAPAQEPADVAAAPAPAASDPPAETPTQEANAAAPEAPVSDAPPPPDSASEPEVVADDSAPEAEPHTRASDPEPVATAPESPPPELETAEPAAESAVPEPSPAASEPEPVAPPAAPEPEPEAAVPEPEPEAPEPVPAPAPKPRDIGMPPLTPEAEIAAAPAILAASFRPRKLDPIVAAQMKPLLEQLSGLRDSMQARRGRGTPGN